MLLSLFDLHADTALAMLETAQGLTENTLAVSINQSKCFKHYAQVMALWTRPRFSDEDGWSRMLCLIQNLKDDPALLSENARIMFESTPTQNVASLWLSIEDARILNRKEERVDTLYELGVRLITPLWAGKTCIGGAHNTDAGLTPFGKRAIAHAIRLGMIADISHASERSADQIVSLCAEHKRPVIASHSNSYAVCPVSRNLRDRQIQAILEADGLIGLNLHRDFLTESGTAKTEDILRHIEYFLKLGAERALCLGCDWDGGDPPPEFSNIGSLYTLAEEMQKRNYNQQLIHSIFYNNARRFFDQYL